MHSFFPIQKTDNLLGKCTLLVVRALKRILAVCDQKVLADVYCKLNGSTDIMNCTGKAMEKLELWDFEMVDGAGCTTMKPSIGDCLLVCMEFC